MLLHGPRLFASANFRRLSYIHHVGKEPLRSLTIGNLLEISARKYDSRPAVISRHQKRVLSFAEALQQADRMAAGLLTLGLVRGDRVGIWSPNTLEWYLTMMACNRAGLLFVTINPAYQTPEIEYCIKKVGLKGIVCAHKFKTQDYYEMLRAVCGNLETSEPGNLKSATVPMLKTIVMVTEDSLRGVYSLGEVLERPDRNKIKEIQRCQNSIQADDACNIQFTSGTTGQPKAAVLSHFNIVNNGRNVGLRAEYDQKWHKICVPVPFFHTYGVTIVILGTLSCGTTIVLPDASFNPQKTLEALEQEQCTIVCGTPTMYVDLINEQKQTKANLSTMEIALSGGATCSPHLFKQMKEVLQVKKVKSLFGMTESSPVIFESLPGDDENKSIATVGHVGDHLEVKVIDEEERIVPFGTPGELCVRGYGNMLGYWDDASGTKEMIGPDGWLKTGDRFILEEDGYGRIVGRLKDLIIRGGENIFPREIEDYLNTHPDVLECHVIGLTHERLGEEVCACIRLKQGSSITLDALADFCKGNLAHYKIPSQLRIVEDFPKTQSGKIQKYKLREFYDVVQKPEEARLVETNDL